MVSRKLRLRFGLNLRSTLMSWAEFVGKPRGPNRQEASSALWIILSLLVELGLSHSDSGGSVGNLSSPELTWREDKRGAEIKFLPSTWDIKRIRKNIIECLENLAIDEFY